MIMNHKGDNMIVEEECSEAPEEKFFCGVCYDEAGVS
jgi:hypothetical protein